MSNEPGCTFEKREDKIEPNADQRGLHASFDHLFGGLPSCHTSSLSPIRLVRDNATRQGPRLSPRTAAY
jgi:hypothetical protein